MSVQAISWVLDRSQAKGNARCVLISIANHADNEGRNAWPSIKTIADQSRCSVRTASAMVAQLVASGELVVEPDAGRSIGARKTNRYSLPLMQIAANPAPIPKSQYVQDPVAIGAGSGDQYVQTVAQEPSLEPSLGSKNSNNAREEAFEIFWQTYPRKVAKLAARKAWTGSVKRGVDPVDIQTGAQRYAAHVATVDDPRYVKHPATWLNGGCWEDVLQPVRPPPRKPGPAERSLRNYLGDDGWEATFGRHDRDGLGGDHDGGLRQRVRAASHADLPAGTG